MRRIGNIGIDGCHHLADLDGFSFGDQDCEFAGVLCVNGHGDLIGLENKQRIFDCNHGSVGLGPLGEKALGDGLSDLRDFDFFGHSGVLLVSGTQSGRDFERLTNQFGLLFLVDCGRSSRRAGACLASNVFHGSIWEELQQPRHHERPAAAIASLLLCPHHVSGSAKGGNDAFEELGVERIELFDADDRDIVDASLFPARDEVVKNLAAA